MANVHLEKLRLYRKEGDKKEKKIKDKEKLFKRDWYRINESEMRSQKFIWLPKQVKT